MISSTARMFLVLAIYLLLPLPGRPAAAQPDTALACGGPTPAVEISVDTDRSQIRWRGTEMRSAGKHEGTVNMSSGNLLYIDGRLSGGRLYADMNSIAITDIPEHETLARRNLRNHLKSDDFFHTKEYPTAAFEITGTHPVGADSLHLRGVLTIRDVSKPIALRAWRQPVPDGSYRYTTHFTIDRFKWNIAYQGSFWEKITSILDNSLVDSGIDIEVEVITAGSPVAGAN